MLSIVQDVGRYISPRGYIIQSNNNCLFSRWLRFCGYLVQSSRYCLSTPWLLFCSSSSHSPAPHARIDLVSRDAIFYEPHCNSQNLDVLVPALVIEEEHLIVFNPTIFVYLCEVRRLAARVYLHVIKVIYRASRRNGCVRYLEEL